ncbi:hypothetical protein ACHAW6_008740 [Cyclotella cf. meneghiniana]
MASTKLRLRLALFLTWFHANVVALSPYASQKKALRQLTAATLQQSPSFTVRQMKKKSNDVGSIVVPLLTFTVALTTVMDDAGALNVKHQQLEDSAVDQELQALAVSALNASSFAQRFYDLELHVSYLPSSLQQHSTLAVDGNATFTGSYYLDDPEPQQVTAILVQDWNQNKINLMEALSPILCAHANAHGNGTCELHDLTVNLIDDVAMTPYLTNITLSDAYANETIAIDNAAMDNQRYQQDDLSSSNLMSYRSNAEDTAVNNTSGSLAWIIPTIIASTFIFFVALWMTYRRLRKETKTKDMPRVSHKHQEVRRPTFNNTSAILKHNQGRTVTKNNNASTTFSDQNNIDQIIQEFTNNYDDMSLVSSDPSEIGNASFFSSISGFHHFDLERASAKSVFLPSDAVSASSEVHSHAHGTRESHRNGSMYLPSSLRKQESFEGKYRTISAMANVLKKDILLMAGEMTPQLSGNGDFKGGENETMGVSRTESPNKRKESMERQGMVDGGETDAHDVGVDVCSAEEEVEFDGDS